MPPVAARCQQWHAEPCDARCRPGRPYWAAPRAVNGQTGVVRLRLMRRRVHAFGWTCGPRCLQRQGYVCRCSPASASSQGELSRTPYRGPSMRAGPAPLPSRHPWIGHLLRRWALDPQAVLTRADEIARLAAGEPVNTISGMAATRQRAVSDGYQMIAELRRVADRNAVIHSDGQECLGR